MYTCPECEAEINQASEICPKCGADLDLLQRAALAAEPGKRRSATRLVVLWTGVILFIAGSIYAFVWFVLPEYSATESPHESEARAIHALKIVQSGLARYSAAAGNFPESLEALGPQERTVAQMALGGYTLQYAAGTEPGGARTYILTARAGRYGLRNFYTDQTGVVHTTKENRAALPTDPAL